MCMKCRREKKMPSKQTKGHAPSHDIEYKAGRRINWKNDLAVGQKGEAIFQRLFRFIR